MTILNQEAVRNYYRLSLDYSGVVTSPGKFEGEHWTTVAAYDLAMDGDSQETLEWPNGLVTEVIILDSELREAWNFKSDTYALLVDLRSDGFVSGMPVSRDDYDGVSREYEDEIASSASE